MHTRTRLGRGGPAVAARAVLFFFKHKKALLAYFPPTKHGALPSHIERARRNAAHSRGIFYSNSWLACRCGVTATATRGGHAASHVAPKRLWHEKQLRRAAAACPGSTPHLRTRRAPARARCNARSRSRCSNRNSSPQAASLRGFVRRFCFAFFLAIRGPRRPRCPTPDRPQARTYAPNYSALLAVLQNR